VTGAAKGIGRAIAIELARSGFDIVGNDLVYDPDDRTHGLAETQQMVEDLNVGFAPAPGDIADLKTHETILQVAMDRFRRADVLVNNAGVAPLERLDFLDTTPENFDRVLDVNLRGTFFLTQAFARLLIAETARASGGSIIFITSISADVSSPSRAEYCVAKAGLSQLATVCADRLAATGITVFEIRPGVIETDMTAPVKGKYDRLIAEGLIPQARWGTPEDVARAVVSLARGDFGYSTGGVFEVSGGMSIKHL
jgi:NAD(P)-dependent dehydrogenase (short-subunit alcohol dehydrogenase family)